MRILFVGYTEVHSKKWVNILCKRGHEVIFVVPRSSDESKQEIDSRAKLIELPFSGKIGYYLNAPFLKRIERKYHPDVSNVHNASGTGTLARFARLDNVMLSVWGHDVYGFPYKNKLCMNIIRKNLLHAKAIGSTSYCMAEKVYKLIGHKRPVTVTPFGIDTNKFNPERFKRKQDDTIVIGNVKSLSPKYGIEDLIKAIDILKKDLQRDKQYSDLAPKLRCKIYGSGVQEKELRELIRKLQLDSVVFLMGEVSNTLVPEAMSKMDIFCAASILDSESFGVAAVEAQAMELPVVVSDVEGFCEVVEDGVTGIIVKRKNIQEIAAGLKRLVTDKELCYRMGKNGRKRVLEKYDIEYNVIQMEEAYKKAVNMEPQCVKE